MANGIPRQSILTNDALHPDLHADFYPIENIVFIQEVLNSSPLVCAIINRKRQVVLTNFHMHELAGFKSIEQLIGKRPGDFFSCMNRDEFEGCGASEQCEFCGILQTILQSQAQKKKIVSECRITSIANNNLTFYDFRVTCIPVFFNNVMYTMMNLMDISHEKRSTFLENVFFHDIMNRLGGLSGIIQVIKLENNQNELHEYIDILETISEMVIDEIQSQRYLKAAENQNLILNIQDISAFEIFEMVRKQIAFHPVMNTLKLSLDPGNTDFRLNTDSTLLKRILFNMTKNAAEATPENGTIRVSFRKNSGRALFSITNPGVIPRDIQLQIFQRSFSTKGPGRGLGTYSMKLFGENYLKGKVFFTSDELSGTTFTVELPVD